LKPPVCRSGDPSDCGAGVVDVTDEQDREIDATYPAAGSVYGDAEADEPTESG
jgi:hypothetical protein